MRRTILWFILLLSLTTLSISPLVAQDQPQSITAKRFIVFVRECAIWEHDIKTGREFALIAPPITRCKDTKAPSWSHGGNKIAAVVDGNLWVADIISRKSHMIAKAKSNTDLYGGTPAWSKDGTYLVIGRNQFHGACDGDGGLWAINVKTGNIRQLIPPDDAADLVFQDRPTISTDGRFVASKRDCFGELFIFDSRGQKTVAIPQSKIKDSVACYAWDKHSNTLLVGTYSKDDGLSVDFVGENPGGVWRWDLTTNKITPWLLLGKHISEISISPNGEELIIQVGEGNDGVLYQYSKSGQNVGLIHASRGASNLSWLDNETILITVPSGIAGRCNILRYNIRTGDSTTIIKGGFGASTASGQ